MNNIYTIHPKKSPLILLYEVVDEDGRAEWGGHSAEHCMQWLSLAPTGSRVLVSGWESDEEDAHLVGQSLDITDIIKRHPVELAALLRTTKGLTADDIARLARQAQKAKDD